MPTGITGEGAKLPPGALYRGPHGESSTPPTPAAYRTAVQIELSTKRCGAVDVVVVCRRLQGVGDEQVTPGWPQSNGAKPARRWIREGPDQAEIAVNCSIAHFGSRRRRGSPNRMSVRSPGPCRPAPAPRASCRRRDRVVKVHARGPAGNGSILVAKIKAAAPVLRLCCLCFGRSLSCRRFRLGP